MPTNGPCPYCGAEDYLWLDMTGSSTHCSKCGKVTSHEHAGVLIPVACGPLIGFWVRFFRWCWLKEPHLHCSCSVCHGKWLAPPVGVKGEIRMVHPKKPKNRYQRDPVI